MSNKKKANKPINRDKFPKEFPFWARLKFGKNRPTLVIDEDLAKDKKKKKLVPGFVHREVIHTYKKNYEEVFPNPDKSDPKPMYLKKPVKTPIVLFTVNNKKMEIPKNLKEKYKKNNKK